MTTEFQIAKQQYQSAGAEVKKVLEEIFGKESFLPIMDRVKSFEDVRNIYIKTIDSGALNNIDILSRYNGVNEALRGAVAAMKLSMISAVLNEGWTPDWNDGDQYKYFPWFEYKSGVGFSYSDCDNTYANTYLGSRLCFPDCATAVWFGETYQDLFKDYLLFN